MSYIALATTTLSSSAATVTFSSIPTTVNGTALRDLIVVVTGTGTGNTGSSLIQFNNDTGNNYSEVAMFGLGSGSGGNYTTSNVSVNQGMFFRTTQGTYIMQILDAMATDKHKTILSRMDVADYATFVMAARYASTSVISTIKLQNANSVSFASGTTLSLYGVA
jgi:hypothetical protein